MTFFLFSECILVLSYCFVLECKDHFYGSDCLTPCGHCLNNETCEQGTGQCPNGCVPHWQMNKCDSKFLKSAKLNLEYLDTSQSTVTALKIWSYNCLN